MPPRPLLSSATAAGALLDVRPALEAAVRFGARLDRERSLAPALYRRWRRCSDGGPPAPRYRLLGFCELLLDESRKAVFETPHRALELAHSAVEIAGLLDDEIYGPGLVQDLTARAWGRVGNALRVVGDHREAARAFRTAAGYLEGGTGDLLTAAELLDLEASLLKSQRHYGDALQRLERVIVLYRRLHDHHRMGRALISSGTVRGDSGDLEGAIVRLREGLRQIDPGTEPRLEVCARHNLRMYLEESGRRGETAELAAELAETEPRAGDGGQSAWVGLRRRWAAGRSALRDGAEAEAEKALREARRGFIELGLAYDAALVSLDLGLLFAERGDSSEMKRLAAETLPIFRACDVDREAMASVMLFCRAAEAETVTAAMVRELARTLRGRPSRHC